MSMIIYTPRKKAGTVVVNTVVTGVPDDFTVFRATLTGQSEEPTIVGPFDISQESPVYVRNLPFDTYVLTVENEEGYTLDSVTPSSIVLTRGNRVESVVVTEFIASTGPLELVFDDISNAPVSDHTQVGEWNAFFDLPTNGIPFVSVEIIGGTVKLYGSNSLVLNDALFTDVTSLLSIKDNSQSVISAGSVVFQGCTNLSEVMLNTITYADTCCFYGCNNLATLSVNSLTTVGNSCFAWCSSLTNPDFSSLTMLGEGCFINCTGLTNPDFSSLAVVGDSCFMNCVNLTSDFPALVTASYRSFYNCESLVSPDFSLLEIIGEEGFSNCDSLTAPDFSSIQTLGDYCFTSCNLFTTMTFPSLVNVGASVLQEHVFWTHFGLTITLTIPAALMTCNGGAIEGDIQRLIDNNTLTIYDPNGNQLYPV